jgi:phenylacetate-CoA ligase
LPSLRFILGSYEFVSVAHRRILERVFGVPVFNLYGSTETGHLLMEVGRGELRPSLETALLEVLNTDAQGVSDLAVTTLTNDYMPLIRYHIGDLVERQERPYYTSYVVHGRAKDAFATPDGRRITVWQVDQCLADLPGIAHYQLCERTNAEWLLRFIPDITAPTAAEIEEWRRRLIQLLGIGGSLAVERTDLLAPESSGKFRLTYPAK